MWSHVPGVGLGEIAVVSADQSPLLGTSGCQLRLLNFACPGLVTALRVPAPKPTLPVVIFSAPRATLCLWVHVRPSGEVSNRSVSPAATWRILHQRCVVLSNGTDRFPVTVPLITSRICKFPFSVSITTLLLPSGPNASWVFAWPSVDSTTSTKIWPCVRL